LGYVAGYTIINDISEREFQLERDGGQWLKGKVAIRSGRLDPDWQLRMKSPILRLWICG